MHDAASADLRREASRKGGRARANSVRARKLLPTTLTPEELGGHLSKLLIDVIENRVSPKVGTAAATITRAMLDVRAAGELEARVAELEALAGLERRSA